MMHPTHKSCVRFGAQLDGTHDGLPRWRSTKKVYPFAKEDDEDWSMTSESDYCWLYRYNEDLSHAGLGYYRGPSFLCHARWCFCWGESSINRSFWSEKCCEKDGTKMPKTYGGEMNPAWIRSAPRHILAPYQTCGEWEVGVPAALVLCSNAHNAHRSRACILSPPCCTGMLRSAGEAFLSARPESPSGANSPAGAISIQRYNAHILYMLLSPAACGLRPIVQL